VKYNPVQFAHELREQLSSDKRRLAFFVGAGASMAAGLPGIIQLTKYVGDALSEELIYAFKKIQSEVGSPDNIEHILNRVRLIRELLADSDSLIHNEIPGGVVKKLDSAICKLIHEAVNTSKINNIDSHNAFGRWIRSSHDRRDTPIEIFTTNYDLMFETALEDAMVPYFDGFIGSVNPFFSPESVEIDGALRAPRSWCRLWKLHGSVNWSLKPDVHGNVSRVVRNSANIEIGESDLMVFPSREKYLESRKLPFITFQDRLRRFTSNGEGVVFILGYSFSDQHLNEILFQALRTNSRLAINALVYGSDGKLPESIEMFGKLHKNLSIIGPDKAVIGGLSAEWEKPETLPQNAPYWNNDAWTLGDFRSFAKYLDHFVGSGYTYQHPDNNVADRQEM
jgi:hypothetical protein